MANIISPSPSRPLIEPDSTMTDEVRDFFNLIRQFKIQGDGSPVGAVAPLFVGQDYVDVTAGEAYTAVGETSADWKQIT